MKTARMGNARVFLLLCGLVHVNSIPAAARQAAPLADAAGLSGTASSAVECREPAPQPENSPEQAQRVFPCLAGDNAEQTPQAGQPPAGQEQEKEKQPGATKQSAQGQEPPGGTPAEDAAPQKQQPKRILGLMPNFKAVTAGTLPPPPTPKQSFILATQNSFDYSSFIFVGFTSALAEWTDTHPQLGQGMPGFGRYYWRGFVDKTNGNYLVLFALPTLFHQDERYFAKGKGGFWRRSGYAATRVFVTPNYQGHNSFNISELLGRGMAQAISVSYYPSQSRTAGAIAAKYAYAIMRDAITNVVREFWPDIATHVLHRRS